MSNDASKNNMSTSILPPIFSLLPSTKSNSDENNKINENKDLKDNNKNESNPITNSTTTNSSVSLENSDIYKNKKNLPPMKRFKIFHHLNNTHCADEPENLAIIGEPSNDSNNNKNSNNNNTNSNNSNSLSNSDNLTENKPENNDNKLLGLANIALERETN